MSSLGMRVTALQFTPSVVVLYTRSLVEHSERNRQSSHTVQTVPAPSTAADGNGPLRIPPASAWNCTFEIITGAVQLNPPFLELKADMALVSMGTTTVPFGCTSGWPPIPVAKFAVGVATPHVSPPSVEVLIKISSELRGSSHST